MNKILNQKGIAFIPLLVWAFVSLTGIAAIFEATGHHISLSNSPVTKTPTVTSTSIPMPTLTNVASPVPKSTKIPSVSNSPAKSDVDPTIECQNPNCGPIKIKRSLCSDTTGYICCQIGNMWGWYSSRDKCAADQKKYAEIISQTIDCYDLLTQKTYKVSQSTCDKWRTEYYQKQSASSNYTSPAVIPSPMPTSVEPVTLDCTVDNQNIGKLTYEDCIKKIHEYWGSKRNEIEEEAAARRRLEEETANQYATYQYHERVRRCQARMRGLGMQDSSYAEYECR